MNTLKDLGRLDEIELTIDNTYEMITHYMIAESNTELWNAEADHLYDRLRESIMNDIYMEERFKNYLDQALADVVCEATHSAFQKGLKMGLSLLRNLITAEVPKIETVPALERQPKQASNISGFIPLEEKDRQLAKLLNKALLVLNEKDKGKLTENVLCLIYDR